MNTTSIAVPKSSSALKAILLGGLIAGTCDITYAFIYYGTLGASPIRILQSVASGALGRASFNGGLATAALGLFFHFFIATTAAAVYYGASRKLAFLIEKPFLFGPVYGLCVYLFMNYVVIPLSAIHRSGSHRTWEVITGVLVHMFLIGGSIAVVARRYSR